AAAHLAGRGGEGGGLRHSRYTRQIYLDGRAAPALAVHPDIAAALLDDSVHGGETEPGTLADLFRREKRLEEVCLRRFIHADAGVAHHETGIVTGRQAMPALDVLLV